MPFVDRPLSIPAPHPRSTKVGDKGSRRKTATELHAAALSLVLRLEGGACSGHRRTMLRQAKKYSVYDLRQLKGKHCLTHVHVKSPEEAAAAEAADIDLLSCSFDSPESQARLPQLVAAAPQSFISGATPHGLASPEEAIRVGVRALELGARSVYCSASPMIIEARAREGIPVVGQLGMVPRHATWTNVRAIGKSPEEA